MTTNALNIEIEPSVTPDAGVLPAGLRLGEVELVVTDLDRSVEFYERSIGLRVLRRDEGRVWLGSDAEAVLVLHERPDARPAGRHAGLYHVALLYPSRLELARTLRRMALLRTPIQGASDHGTHEALYLPDPDGNGLELAADRPRDQWKPYDLDGIGPRPLDVEGLLSLVDGEPVHERAEPGVRTGHLHLHVGDVREALEFYVGVVGFEEQFRFDSAGFVSAGGYHHHLGLNVWKGQGVPPAPAGAVGMRSWRVLLPDQADVDALRARLEDARAAFEPMPDGDIVLRDPWNNALRVAVAPAGAKAAQ